MTFRSKLLVLFTLTVVVVVAAVAAAVSAAIRRASDQADERHTAALVAEYRAEFARRGEEVARGLEAIAGREATIRMAAALAQPGADASAFVNEAEPLARTYGLDFLEFVRADGAIISSAQWPARFGYKDDSFPRTDDVSAGPAFLKREELPDGSALALTAVRRARVEGATVFVVGGSHIDRNFLSRLALPAGMRALLYANNAPSFAPAGLSAASGAIDDPQKLQPLIDLMRRDPQERSAIVYWTPSPADSESVHAIPLIGRLGDVLGVLLVGASRRDLIDLQHHIRLTAILVGVGGVLLGMLLSAWAAVRITRPVERLAEAAREVAAGHLEARVPVTSHDELGDLAEAFNQMTRDLLDHRERLLQSERVAAWRELARRLAHELKNPLFPLQITVENLVRARAATPEQFEEVFQESTTALLQELANMKAIVGRFSDFAKMPSPQLQPVQVNDVLTQVASLMAPQLQRAEGGALRQSLQLEPGLPLIYVDRDLLYRAVQNLVLNAIDAMPTGGTLTLRTSRATGSIRLDVSDTGQGLAREECERLFTPYYTTKQHGTGLGLAIVQSVVSDHHGKIWVESDSGRGTTFHIELPIGAGPQPAEEAHV